MPKFNKSVTVHSGGAPAQRKPRFIIKVNDVYYYTLAVWEYDKTKAGNDTAAAKRCDDMKQRYDGAVTKGNRVDAVIIDAVKGAGGKLKTSDSTNPDPIGDGHGNTPPH